jgi:putative membrane protein
MHLISIPAILLGFILWQHYGIGMGPGNKWLHAKLLGVILLIGYHHSCGVLLKKFKRNQNKRSVRWFKWFNEVPVIIVLAIIFLVVAKPF